MIETQDNTGQDNARAVFIGTGMSFGALCFAGVVLSFLIGVDAWRITAIGLVLITIWLLWQISRVVTHAHDRARVRNDAGSDAVRARAAHLQAEAKAIESGITKPAQMQLPPPTPASINFTPGHGRQLVRDPDPAPSQPVAPVPDVDPAILIAFAEMIEEGKNPSLNNLSIKMKISDHNDYTDALDFLGDSWVERGGARRPTRWVGAVWSDPAANAEALRAQAHAIGERGG